jgi:hypothetical protein
MDIVRLWLAIPVASLMAAFGCSGGDPKIRAPKNPQPLPAPTLDAKAGFQAPPGLRPIHRDEHRRDRAPKQ